MIASQLEIMWAFSYIILLDINTWRIVFDDIIHSIYSILEILMSLQQLSIKDIVLFFYLTFNSKLKSRIYTSPKYQVVQAFWGAFIFLWGAGK